MLQGINKNCISRKARHISGSSHVGSFETATPVNIKYLHQIDEKELLFVGETDNEERICIKFVRRHPKAVHE